MSLEVEDGRSVFWKPSLEHTELIRLCHIGSRPLTAQYMGSTIQQARNSDSAVRLVCARCFLSVRVISLTSQ